jgi:hypothetical protein
LGRVIWRRRCSTDRECCKYNYDMLHRHLTHQQFTLAAIDDLIARGKRGDRAILEKVQRVCDAHVADPYAQRYHFWKHYAERHLA